jgi:Protein of unknown function (DUF1488)
MPLTRSNEQILTTMMGVKFLMRDGNAEVACRAAREMLRYRFGSSDGDGETFRLHREAIEKAASDKYDAGMVEPQTDATVVVREVDMASSLSRKM